MIALSKKHGGPEAYSSGLRLEKAGGKVRQQICSDKAFVSLRSTPVGYRGARRLRGSGPRDASVCQRDAQQSSFGETRFHQRFQYPAARRHAGLCLSNHSGNLLIRPPGLLDPVCPRIGHLYLSIYLSVCLSVFLSVYLSIYLSIYLSTGCGRKSNPMPYLVDSLSQQRI